MLSPENDKHSPLSSPTVRVVMMLRSVNSLIIACLIVGFIYMTQPSISLISIVEATNKDLDACGSLAVSNLLLMPSSRNKIMNVTEQKELDEALFQIGPDLRQLRDFTDEQRQQKQTNNNITHNASLPSSPSMEMSVLSWKLMRHHAQQVLAQKLHLLEPILIETLIEANVSSKCLKAGIETLKAATRLESWAIQSK